MRSARFAGLVLLGLACLPGVRAGAEEPAIKIGYFGGLSGRNGASSTKALRAIELALQEAQKSGWNGSRRIQILRYDNESNPARNITLFERAKKDGVQAITGVHISNDGLLIARLAESSRIPMVVASATNPEISAGMKYVVQVCFTDDVQGRVLGDFALKRLKAKSIAVIEDVADQASATVAEEFSTYVSKNPDVLLRRWSIRTGNQDFTRLSKELGAGPRPELVFISASSIESAFVIRQLQKDGLRFVYLGTDNWQNQDFRQLLSKLGVTGIQSFFPGHWHLGLDRPAARRLIREYRSTYSEALSDFDADAALAYDAASLLLSSIREALKAAPSVREPDVDAVMEAIRKRTLDGATGEVSFDSSGKPRKTLHMLELNGRGVMSLGEFK